VQAQPLTGDGGMDYFRRVDRHKKVTKDTILSSAATRNTHAIGRSSSSLIDQSGDRDWFKVNLVAGNTYKLPARGLLIHCCAYEQRTAL